MTTGSYGLGTTLLAMTLAASFSCIDAASAQASSARVKEATQGAKAPVSPVGGAIPAHVASNGAAEPAVKAMLPPVKPTAKPARKGRKPVARASHRHAPLDLSSPALRAPVVSSLAEPGLTKRGPKAATRAGTEAQQRDVTSSPPRSAGTGKGSGGDRIQVLLASYAAANGIPVELAAAVVRVESRFNPRARNGANVGLTQISTSTARAMGYRGSVEGLYDADTNLRYGIRYLAEAYRLAGGDTCRTVLKYQAGHRATSMTGAARAYCAKVRPHVSRR
ncbi:lytic transglycosylase domain-containing protein [Chelatococcus sp. GCM10030263]|uniref:lytic transglycosylase domain-containing protein n=1 Tax=Chelatococcus sp. GCM10030263 TaxID=3273387 RepID=UPI003607664F